MMKNTPIFRVAPFTAATAPLRENGRLLEGETGTRFVV